MDPLPAPKLLELARRTGADEALEDWHDNGRFGDLGYVVLVAASFARSLRVTGSTYTHVVVAYELGYDRMAASLKVGARR